MPKALDRRRVRGRRSNCAREAAKQSTVTRTATRSMVGSWLCGTVSDESPLGFYGKAKASYKTMVLLVYSAFNSRQKVLNRRLRKGMDIFPCGWKE